MFCLFVCLCLPLVNHRRRRTAETRQTDAAHTLSAVYLLLSSEVNLMQFNTSGAGRGGGQGGAGGGDMQQTGREEEIKKQCRRDRNRKKHHATENSSMQKDDLCACVRSRTVARSRHD